MPTECSPDCFAFPPVEGRDVVAAFDGGTITSDAGALLLGGTDRAIKLVDRFAACFSDSRSQALIDHEVATLVGQRVFGIALGYEDLIGHDTLRHDPMMALLAGKLAARRAECAPVAGKSTLNRLELSQKQATRYHKIAHDPAAIEGLLVDLFLEAHAKAPRQIILDLDATDDPLHGDQEGRFFHGYYDSYCYLLELQALQHPVRLMRREGFIERARCMRRQIVQHHANKIGTWVVDIDQIAHAVRKVGRGAMIRNLHVTPGFVGVQKHKQISGAIAPVFAIVPFRLRDSGRDRLSHLANQLRRALIETYDGILRIGFFRV